MALALRRRKPPPPDDGLHAAVAAFFLALTCLQAEFAFGGDHLSVLWTVYNARVFANYYSRLRD